MIRFFIQAGFFLNSAKYMRARKEMTKIYDLPNAETKPKFLCQLYTKQRIFFPEKEFCKEKGKWRIEQKQKESFLTALAPAIKKDPPQHQ